MNGLSSLRSHRRTSSGERVRDSTGFSQRLSTYDNVTSSSSMGSGPSVASTPWSTSSCDISASDSGSEPSGPNCGNGKGLEECQWQELASPQGPGQGQRGGRVEERVGDRVSEQEQDSSEAMELCVSSAGCSDNRNTIANMVVPSIVTPEDLDGGSKALTSLVEGLKDELRKQKVAYETRIKKYVCSLFIVLWGFISQNFE